MDALRRAEETRRTQAKDDESKTPQRAPESGAELSLAPADAPTPDADAAERELGEGARESPRSDPPEEPPAPAGGAQGGERADARATLTLSPMESDAPDAAPGATSESPEARSGTRTWSSDDFPPGIDARHGTARGSTTRAPAQAARVLSGAAAARRRGRAPLVSVTLVLTLIVLGAGAYRYWRAVSSGPSVMVRSSPAMHAVGSVQPPSDLHPTAARVGPSARPTPSTARTGGPPTRSEPTPPGEGDALASSGPAGKELDMSAAERAPSFGSFGPESPRDPSGVSRAADGAGAPAPGADDAAAVDGDPDGGALTAAAVGGAGSEIRITRAPRTDPVRTLLAQAYEAFRDGDDTLAGARYREALERDAGNRDALLGLAAVAVRRGDLEQAARRYLQLLRRNPRDSVAQAGLIGLQTGADPVASESRLKLLLEEEPGAAHLHFSLGNLYAEQGRWPEAERAYFEAYRADSHNPDYALNLAVSLDHMQQRAAALTYYRRALELASLRRGSFEPLAVHERIRALSQSVEGS